MALIADPAVLRRFVLDALVLAGAAHTQVDEDLIVASCRVKKPAGFFGGCRIVQEDLQMVFTPEGAAKYPTAELICAGSHRLLWLIANARERGLFTRQYYAGDLNGRRLEREVMNLLPPTAPRPYLRPERRSFAPFFLAILRLTASALEKREELLPVALNLVDGTERPELPARLSGLALRPDPGFQRVERRRMPWREVWRILREKALARIDSYGTDWYRPALVRLNAEGEQLREYYQEALAGAEDPETVRTEYIRRSGELLEKYRPVVRVSLSNAALLYLPVIRFPAESLDGGPLPPILYEPATGRIEWAVLKPGGRFDEVVYDLNQPVHTHQGVPDATARPSR